MSLQYVLILLAATVAAGATWWDCFCRFGGLTGLVLGAVLALVAFIAALWIICGVLDAIFGQVPRDS